MILIIGGRAQGKREFAMSITGLADKEIFNGETCNFSDNITGVLDKLNPFIKRLYNEKIDPFDFLDKLTDSQPDIAIISDEIGCGIIPLDKEDREIRELVGRIQCFLAKKAKKVYRVYCGIPIIIKGENS